MADFVDVLRDMGIAPWNDAEAQRRQQTPPMPPTQPGLPMVERFEQVGRQLFGTPKSPPTSEPTMPDMPPEASRQGGYGPSPQPSEWPFPAGTGQRVMDAGKRGVQAVGQLTGDAATALGRQLGFFPPQGQQAAGGPSPTGPQAVGPQGPQGGEPSRQGGYGPASKPIEKQPFGEVMGRLAGDLLGLGAGAEADAGSQIRGRVDEAALAPPKGPDITLNPDGTLQVPGAPAAGPSPSRQGEYGPSWQRAPTAGAPSRSAPSAPVAPASVPSAVPPPAGPQRAGTTGPTPTAEAPPADDRQGDRFGISPRTYQLLGVIGATLMAGPRAGENSLAHVGRAVQAAQMFDNFARQSDFEKEMAQRTARIQEGRFGLDVTKEGNRVKEAKERLGLLQNRLAIEQNEDRRAQLRFEIEQLQRIVAVAGAPEERAVKMDYTRALTEQARRGTETGADKRAKVIAEAYKATLDVSGRPNWPETAKLLRVQYPGQFKSQTPQELAEGRRRIAALPKEQQEEKRKQYNEYLLQQGYLPEL